MKNWTVRLWNLAKMRLGKILILVLVSGLTSTALFTNCAQKKNADGNVVKEEILPLSCGSDCGPTFHPEQTKVENTTGQVIDVRQTVESFMSLLDLKREDLTTAELNSLVAEKNRRMALLPQENDIKLQSTVSVLSQASLAGEVCKLWAQKKAPLSDFVAGIDLKQPAEATPTNNWINLFLKMAQESWGRPITAIELTSITEFYEKSVEAAIASPNRTVMEGGYNVESMNLLIMSCTGVLSAPEAVMF